MIRLIATDLDDTLLDPHGIVTARTLSALRSAMDAGVQVVLSSGRMLEGVVPLAQFIGTQDPMILFNGGLIFDPRTSQTLFAQSIPLETARRVARQIEDAGAYLQAYPGRGYFCSRRTQETADYEKHLKVPCEAVGRPLHEWMHQDMVKMLAIASPDAIDSLQHTLKEAFPSGVSFMKSKPSYLEIVAQDVDKGRALDALRMHLGLEREEVMAFGDGQNDAAMLRQAGWGVAMDNACPECKNVARLIAPSNAEDGVAQIIEQHILHKGV